LGPGWARRRLDKTLDSPEAIVVCGTTQGETSPLTTYWSELTLSSRWFGGPAWLHGSLNSLFQVGYCTRFSGTNKWTQLTCLDGDFERKSGRNGRNDTTLEATQGQIDGFFMSTPIQIPPGSGGICRRSA